MTAARADALVLFGATGDLSKRKLFPALYSLVHHGRLEVPIIGVARDSWTDEAFRQHARESIEKFVTDPDPVVTDQAVRTLDLVTGDYSSMDTFRTLRDTLDRLGSTNAVFYLAIPPSAFELVITSLAAQGLNTRGRVVVEKPFGRDLASAKELNRILHDAFPEERIFRIDHYLGKESVEDLLVFRFSNSLLEPIWNRNYVESVQLTMAETIGVDAGAASMTRWARYETWCRTTCCRSWRCWRWSRPWGPRRAICTTRRRRCSPPCSRCRASTSCAASTAATTTNLAWRPARRSRRSPQCA